MTPDDEASALTVLRAWFLSAARLGTEVSDVPSPPESASVAVDEWTLIAWRVRERLGSAYALLTWPAVPPIVDLSPEEKKAASLVHDSAMRLAWRIADDWDELQPVRSVLFEATNISTPLRQRGQLWDETLGQFKKMKAGKASGQKRLLSKSVRHERCVAGMRKLIMKHGWKPTEAARQLKRLGLSAYSESQAIRIWNDRDKQKDQ